MPPTPCGCSPQCLLLKMSFVYFLVAFNHQWGILDRKVDTGLCGQERTRWFPGLTMALRRIADKWVRGHEPMWARPAGLT